MLTGMPGRDAGLFCALATLYPTSMPIDFLYTNIGRGHPHYLDGLRQSLAADHVGRVTDVFSVSGGAGRAAWELARYLYYRGGRGGATARWYNRLRRTTDYNNPSLAQRVMADDLKRWCRKSAAPLAVAHPALVGMLAADSKLLYVHGELVVPDEALVCGARWVAVPTEAAAQHFIEIGYERDQVRVHGLGIEPELIPHAVSSYNHRLDRLRRFEENGLSANEPISVAIFSSGAEPAPHLDLIGRLLKSTERTSGAVRALVFAAEGGRLERLCQQRSFPCVSFASRNDLNQATAGQWETFDLLIAPPHERVNWALGLGLPMVPLTPTFGSFAPLNLDLIRRAGVAVDGDTRIETIVDEFPSYVEHLLKRQQLSQAAQRGWSKLPIDGFTRLAALIASDL